MLFDHYFTSVIEWIKLSSSGLQSEPSNMYSENRTGILGFENIHDKFWELRLSSD